MIRLAVNLADQALDRGRTIGVLNLSLGLIKELARHPDRVEVTVYANDRIAEDLPAALKIRRTNVAVRNKLGRVFWEQIQLPGLNGTTGCDCIFVPKGLASFVRRPHLPMVAYIHDNIGAFYDERYPDYFPAIDRSYTRRAFAAALTRSSAVVVNSRFTAAEIGGWAKARGVNLPPVTVVGCGFDHLAATATGPDVERCDQVLLFLNPAPHKRASMSVEFLRRWRRETSFEGKIVTVGSAGPGVVVPAEPGWVVHDRLSNDSVARLFRQSRMLVYASEYEGFGMPPVEAVASGCVPVYSAIPALEEVLEGVGHSFRNDEYSSFVAAMDAAMEAPIATVHAWRDRLLARHSWTEAGERFLGVLEAAL